MKQNPSPPLFAEERREQIIKLLAEQSKLLVPNLCDIFDVSPATIRSDLRDLESEGRLKRTHGGAIPIGKAGFEPDSHSKEVEKIDEKIKIAVYSAGLIEDGDIVALDTGTTTLELAKRLTDKKNLTIVTNDVNISMYLEANSNANIILLGGTVRRGFHCTTGIMTINSLKDLNVDKAFMATNAFSLEKGFTTPSFEHAEVKKAMLSIASQNIMLMDSSKFGRVSFVKFASLGCVDRIVTDKGVGSKTVESILEGNENIELISV